MAVRKRALPAGGHRYSVDVTDDGGGEVSFVVDGDEVMMETWDGRERHFALSDLQALFSGAVEQDEGRDAEPAGEPDTHGTMLADLGDLRTHLKYLCAKGLEVTPSNVDNWLWHVFDGSVPRSAVRVRDNSGDEWEYRKFSSGDWCSPHRKTYGSVWDLLNETLVVEVLG